MLRERVSIVSVCRIIKEVNGEFLPSFPSKGKEPKDLLPVVQNLGSPHDSGTYIIVSIIELGDFEGDIFVVSLHRIMWVGEKPVLGRDEGAQMVILQAVPVEECR